MPSAGILIRELPLEGLGPFPWADIAMHFPPINQRACAVCNRDGGLLGSLGRAFGNLQDANA